MKPARSHGRQSVRESLQPRALMEARPAYRNCWQARVITLFPDLFPGVLGASLTGKAMQDGLWQLHTHDLRSFGVGRHRNVDDTPAGGGAGMVMRADVVGAATDATLAQAGARLPVICLSPRGQRFDQAMARSWAEGPGVIMLCGRFEGIDQRVIDHYGMLEVSLGDFVMTGGELAAQAMLDASVRLLPGVIGNADSLTDESHAAGLLEHPQFTRPAVWQGREIPQVLTSGNHGDVAKWRRAQAEALTRERRPDLLARNDLQDPADPSPKTV